jgi:hypothetical protein
MKKKNHILWLLLLGLMTAGYLVACSSGNAVPAMSPLTETEARALVGPVAENIFQAMNSGDFASYTRDFDARLKNNFSEDTFKTLNTARIETVGTYISKAFEQIVQKNDKLTVVFRAKFTKEPADVFLTLIFMNIAGDWQVDGLIYDSPLMRENNC